MMNQHQSFTTIDPAGREARDNHHTLLSCVLPRAIAFVSTLSEGGVRNLAPFSFFTGICSNPPAVVFCPSINKAGKEKDTLVNLRATGECVINAVSHNMRQAMNQASYPYPPEVDEFQAAGFTPIPSLRVTPPRVAESPAHLECRLIQIVTVGQGPLSGNLCICQVVCFHIADELCLPEGVADIEKIDLIGRLGGEGYSTVRDRFDLPIPRSP